MTRINLIATTKDVAKLAGVSPSTVSYVINQDSNGVPKISDATRSRVLEAMQQLNYVPNVAGRNLRRQHTERICLALSDIGRPYDNILVQDIQKVANQHNYFLIIANGDIPSRRTQIFKQLQQRLADGAIIKFEGIEKKELESLVKLQISLVIFSNSLNPKGFDVVYTNEAEAVCNAVQYLIDRGHHRIGTITHVYIDRSQDLRLNSYCQTLIKNNLPVDESLIFTGADRPDEAYLSTKKLLKLEPRPTAIFASSDRAAISAIWAIRDAGLRIPEDVAVIGAGNILESQYTSPALTTVGPASLDFTEVANLLFSRMQNPSQEGRKYLIEWKLIQRGSA
jgi:LacI family transcriptional regulator